MRAVTLGLCLLFASAPLIARADEAPPLRDEMSDGDGAAPLDGTPLYFALEIRRDGRLIAMPQFLGEVGKVLKAERKQPGASIPDYRLTISPFQASHERFHLKLDLSVPGQRGASQLQMDHGEVRKVELGTHKGDLEIKLLLMKVDSPEFRTLMKLPKQDAGQNAI